jgi:phosphonate transport system substrate-binding protein
MKSFFFLLLPLILSACVDRIDLGSKANPIKIALVPGKDIKVLEDRGNQMKEWFEAHSRLHFSILVPQSYIAVIETLGSKRSDVAFLNTFGSLQAEEKHAARLTFILTNRGKSTYKGIVIVHKNSKAKSLKDLNGKTIAYVDPLSSSGHLMLAYELKKAGIKPRQTMFAGRHDSVVTAVYTRKVDAGATFYTEPKNSEPRDGRTLVKTQFPDVFDKVRILAYTADLPNEGVVLRGDLPVEVTSEIERLFLEWQGTPTGKETLEGMYGVDGLRRVEHGDYDLAREVSKNFLK